MENAWKFVFLTGDDLQQQFSPCCDIFHWLQKLVGSNPMKTVQKIICMSVLHGISILLRYTMFC